VDRTLLFTDVVFDFCAGAQGFDVLAKWWWIKRNLARVGPIEDGY